jgi:hypothetical protein
VCQCRMARGSITLRYVPSRNESRVTLTHPMLQGTWPFISYHLTTRPASEHRHDDDLESCIHVTMWLALRFMSNSVQLDKAQWVAYYQELFNVGNPMDVDVISGRGKGSRAKKDWMLTGQIDHVDDFVINDHPALTSMLSDLALLFNRRYGIHSKGYGPGDEARVQGSELTNIIQSAITTKEGWPDQGAVAKDFLPSSGLLETSTTMTTSHSQDITAVSFTSSASSARKSKRSLPSTAGGDSDAASEGVQESGRTGHQILTSAATAETSAHMHHWDR